MTKKSDRSDIDAALDAVDAVFGNMKRSREGTLEALEEILDKVQTDIDILKFDIKRLGRSPNDNF